MIVECSTVRSSGAMAREGISGFGVEWGLLCTKSVVSSKVMLQRLEFSFPRRSIFALFPLDVFPPYPRSRPARVQIGNGAGEVRRVRESRQDSKVRAELSAAPWNFGGN